MEIKRIIEILKNNKLLKDYKLTYYDKTNYKIDNITYNSKKVIKNSLFICKGFKFKDTYLKEAKEKGAVCYISEKLYNTSLDYIIVSDVRISMAIIAKEFYKKNKDLFKIGITGTKGKTTTVSFLHNILNIMKKKKTAYISTIDYYTGKTYGKSLNTTPESLDLFQMFQEMIDNDLEFVVMEVSSQAVKLNRIYNIDFDIGGFLNIGIDHISKNEHESFKDYLDCKLAFLKKCKIVFLFKNTDKYQYIKKSLKGKKIITFGFDKKSDYVIEKIRKEDSLTTFDICHNKKRETYQINMVGDFNCVNATLAILIAKYLNISYENIKKGLLNTSVRGRMMIYEKDNKKIIIDYAHNELSIETLFKVLKKEYPDYSIVVVIGLPGDKAQNRRKEIAFLLEKYTAFSYLTMDDPGYENVLDICNDIISNFKNYNNYKIIEDREEAIRCAIKNSSFDIIAILGKGHEEYQLIKDKFVPCKSDIEIVETFLLKE